LSLKDLGNKKAATNVPRKNRPNQL